MRNHFDNFLPGILYGYSMFAAGFVMGVVRTLLLVPRVGEVVAVLFEVPIMLPLCFQLCEKHLLWSSRDHWTPVAAMAMACTALATLLLLEIGVSMVLFGRTLHQLRNGFTSPQGAVGLAAQIICSSFPIILQARGHKKHEKQAATSSSSPSPQLSSKRTKKV